MISQYMSADLHEIPLARCIRVQRVKVSTRGYQDSPQLFSSLTDEADFVFTTQDSQPYTINFHQLMIRYTST